jgi:hypothetical protein
MPTFGGARACNASSTGAAITAGRRARKIVMGCMLTMTGKMSLDQEQEKEWNRTDY